MHRPFELIHKPARILFPYSPSISLKNVGIIHASTCVQHLPEFWGFKFRSSGFYGKPFTHKSISSTSRCVCACICMCVQLYVCAYMYACMYVCLCVYKCVCVYMCVCLIYTLWTKRVFITSFFCTLVIISRTCLWVLFTCHPPFILGCLPTGLSI